MFKQSNMNLICDGTYDTDTKVDLQLGHAWDQSEGFQAKIQSNLVLCVADMHDLYILDWFKPV